MGVLVVFLRFSQDPISISKSVFYLVRSLSFHSLNAVFENCLSDWEAALCIQTQTCGHSDIKTTCVEFRTQADTDTDTAMYTPCNNESKKRWGLWNAATYVQWLYTLDSTPNKVTLWDIHKDPLLPFSLINQYSIKKMVLDIVQRISETRIPGKQCKTWLFVEECHVRNIQFY